MIRAAPDGWGLMTGSSTDENALRPGTWTFDFESGSGGFEPPSLIAKSRAYDWHSGLTSMVASSMSLRALYRGEISGRYMECGVAVLDKDSSNSGSPAFNR